MAVLNKNGFKNLPGEALGALINDYLEDITLWERGIVENYRLSYTTARNFVLPMNPPRFELDYAVRRFFAAHGKIIKKSQIVNLTNHNNQNPLREAAKSHSPEAIPRKRRQRRRPPKPNYNEESKV
jgi:poly(A) polymerase